jgi:hypothetical protein
VEEEFIPEEAEAEEVMMVEAYALEPAAVMVLTAALRRRRPSTRVAAPTPPLSPVLCGFEKEPEDVALCLLMLSRNTVRRRRSAASTSSWRRLELPGAAPLSVATGGATAA